MTFKKIAIGLLTFILRSLLFSFIITIVGYSVLTKKFPPDLKRLGKAYSSILKIKGISKEMSAIKENYTGSDAEVQALVIQRNKLSEALSDLNLLDTVKPLTPEDTQAKICQRELETINILKKELKLLDQQYSSLQQRVNLSKEPGTAQHN